MDIYKFSLYLGFTGLAAMTLLGAGHISQGLTHTRSGGGVGSAPSPLPARHGGPSAIRHSLQLQRSTLHASHRIFTFFWSLFSPRVAFSLLLGFGAFGLLVPRAFVPEPYKFLLACGGGFAFEYGLAAPLSNFVFRFASNPARTLESAVCEEARAVTNFDAGGNGLIAIDLDGQVVQVLGVLAAPSRHSGVRVLAGDRLFIEAVDTRKNSCTVSLLD